MAPACAEVEPAVMPEEAGLESPREGSVSDRDTTQARVVDFKDEPEALYPDAELATTRGSLTVPRESTRAKSQPFLRSGTTASAASRGARSRLICKPDVKDSRWMHQALPQSATPHPSEGSQRRWPNLGPLDRRVQDWGKIGRREGRWVRHWSHVPQLSREQEEQLNLDSMVRLLTSMYGSLPRAFDELDFFKNGSLSLIELQEGLYNIIMNSTSKDLVQLKYFAEQRSDFYKRVERIFSEIDKDGSGTISYEEFAAPRVQPSESASEFKKRREIEKKSVAVAAAGNTETAVRKVPEIDVRVEMPPPPVEAFSLKVQNVSLEKLEANAVMHDIFKLAVQRAIANEAGGQVTEKHVQATFASAGGAVAVSYSISPPDGVRFEPILEKLRCSSQLSHGVARHVAKIKGIESVCLGNISVNELTFPEPAAMKDEEDGLISPKNPMKKERYALTTPASEMLRAFGTVLMQRFPSIEVAFEALDISKNGLLSMGEFELGVRNLRLNVDARAVFKELDQDGGGTISVKEFSKVLLLPQDNRPSPYLMQTKRQIVDARRQRSPIPGPLVFHRGKCFASDCVHRPEGEHISSSAGFYSFDRTATGRLDDLIHPNQYPGLDTSCFSPHRGPGALHKGPEHFAEVACGTHPRRGNGWKNGATLSRVDRFGPMIPSVEGKKDLELSAAAFASYAGQTPADTQTVSNAGAYSVALRDPKMAPRLGHPPPRQTGAWRDSRGSMTGSLTRSAPVLQPVR